MVPLPYKIIAILVSSLLVFGGGAYLGYQYCDGQVAQEYADAKDAAIARFSEQADADKQAAIERVQRETVAAERARSARNKGVSDASIKAKSGCGRDAESHSLLLDAINAANGTQKPTGGMPDSLRDGPRTKGWFRP